MSLRRLRPGSSFGGPRKILECFGDYPRTIPGAFGDRSPGIPGSSGDWLGISAAKSFGFGDRVENSLFLKRDGLWMIACPRVRAQHEAGGGGVLQHAVRDSRIQRLYISLIGIESLLEQERLCEQRIGVGAIHCLFAVIHCSFATDGIPRLLQGIDSDAVERNFPLLV